MLSKIGTYITASRCQTFTISLFPALLGYILTDEKRGNTTATFSFVVTAIMVLHAGANLCNTYFDFVDKVKHISEIKRYVQFCIMLFHQSTYSSSYRLILRNITQMRRWWIKSLPRTKL